MNESRPLLDRNLELTGTSRHYRLPLGGDVHPALEVVAAKIVLRRRHLKELLYAILSLSAITAWKMKVSRTTVLSVCGLEVRAPTRAGRSTLLQPFMRISQQSKTTSQSRRIHRPLLKGGGPHSTHKTAPDPLET